MGPPSKPSKSASVADPSKGVRKGGVTKKPQRNWDQYTHIPPTASQVAANGRQVGRNLIKWNRPHMAEKLLLHMEYELVKNRVNIPWDSIAHRLNPGSSGTAVTQYLHRLRLNMLAQGHIVPPVPMKPGGPQQDVAIRGYVRKNLNGDPTITRPVSWTEPIEDRKMPLSDSAWALDALEAKDDAEMQAKGVKSASKDKKAIHPNRSADKKAIHFNRSDGGGVNVENEDDENDDEDEGEYDEDFEHNDLEDEDDQEQVENTSPSSFSATVSMGSTASRTPVKRTRSVDTAFGVVTPKRRTQAGSGLLEGLLNGAVLTTPDGRTYGFTDMADMNLGAFNMQPLQHMQLPQTPLGGGISSGVFTTASSSPDNWDLNKVTPNTRANMFAHLNEWNNPLLASPTQAILSAPRAVAYNYADQDLLAFNTGPSDTTQSAQGSNISSASNDASNLAEYQKGAEQEK